MAKFALLLRDQGFPPGLSPQELQAALQRYSTWFNKVGRVGGEKLKDHNGKVLRASGVTDGPYTESKEVLGGFMIIEAKDYNDAVRLCRDHPHLDIGSIEIREIDPMTK